MKQLQRRVNIAIRGSLLAAVVLLMAPSAASAISVTPQPPELPSAPVFVTSYQVANGVPQYVQLYNTSSELANLSGWTLTITMQYLADPTTGTVGEVVVPIKLDAYLEKGKYMVIASGDSVDNADTRFDLPSDFSSLGVKKLTLTNPNYSSSDKAGEFSEGIRYDLSKSSAGNYTATSTFRPTPQETTLLGGGWYVVPAAPPLRVTAIAANAKQCGPFERDAACYEYITLQGLVAGPDSLILDNYRLRIGYGNQSPSADNAIPLTGELASGQFLSVTTRSDGKPLAITASGGFVWLEDIYGLERYKDTEVGYQNLGVQEHKGQAWGFDSATNGWRWAIANLNAPNNFSIPKPAPAVSVLKPCAANQYRSLETNRCRLLTTATSSLVPCKSGQYRSTETNRCRSLGASSSSSLTPCKPGQFRNPETNRCKSAASVTSALKPCTVGQERNPETNRCRKIASTPPAAKFSVEPIKQSAEEFAGWWALGGIVAAAGTYGAWEWRREVAGAITKIRGVFRSGK